MTRLEMRWVDEIVAITRSIIGVADNGLTYDNGYSREAFLAQARRFERAVNAGPHGDWSTGERES